MRYSNLDAYKIPKQILTILILLAVATAVMWAIAVFTNNSFILTITQGYNNGVKEILSILVGALIASYIGFFVATVTSDQQLEQERIRIATGFYYEIIDIRNALNKFIEDDKNGIDYNLIMLPTIYQEHGLYYVLRKEIFSLENEIIEPLLILYQKLTLLADVQIDYKTGGKSATLTHHVARFTEEDIVTLVSDIKTDIEKILPKLEERKNSS